MSELKEDVRDEDCDGIDVAPKPEVVGRRLGNGDAFLLFDVIMGGVVRKVLRILERLGPAGSCGGRRFEIARAIGPHRVGTCIRAGWHPRGRTVTIEENQGRLSEVSGESGHFFLSRKLNFS